MTPSVRNDRGFALPAVIFLVALLTLLLTSGLSRVQADRQIAEASEATAQAFAIAQSGMQNYMSTLTNRPPDGDSVRVNLTGGYANVIAQLVRNPSDTTENTLYLVRSTGFVINPLAGAIIQAQRSVAQFADWQTGSIELRGALTAANGFRVEGAGSRRFSGIDSLITGCVPLQPPIPGIRTSSVTGGGAASQVGNPGLIQEGDANSLTIANETEIDWAGTLSADFIPDYTSYQPWDMTYPIQRVAGNLTIGSTSISTGILVVPGDLVVNPFLWVFQGIILVGGRLVVNSDIVFMEGLVVTGLNHQFGQNPSRTLVDVGNSYLRVNYRQCYVQNALNALRGMAPVANAWQDTWARY
jgi:type II secretory pathway pseudopilin PulG